EDFLNGLLSYTKKDNKALASYMDKSTSRLNTKVAPFLLAASAYIELKNLETAEVNLSKALAIKPNLTFAKKRRAAIYYQFEKYEKVVQDLNGLLTASETDYNLFFYSGQSKYELKDYSGAIQDLQKVNAGKVNEPKAFFILGNAQFKTSDYKAAVESFSKAIKAGIKDEVLYNNSGKAKFLTKDFSGAVADYSQALQLNSKYGKAYANRAEANAAIKSWEAVTKDLDAASALGEDIAEHDAILSETLFETKKYAA